MKKSKTELVLERTFLFDPNIYMTMVFSLEGDLSEERICDAVKKAYTQNSMTMSKAVLDEKGNLFMEEMEETGCKVFVDSRNWQELLYENERKVFRIDEGELARTFVIPKENGYDLFFIIHHITCDGNGILVFAEDVFANLQGKEVEYRVSKVMTKEECLKKGNLNFLQKLGLKKLREGWEAEERQFTWDDYYKIHEDFWKTRKTEITFEETQNSELEEMRAICKRLGVTVNSYIVTKYMQGYTGRTKLAVPTSVRNGDRSISCLISSVIVYATYDEKKTFEENLVAMDKILRKRIKNIGCVYYIPQFVAISSVTNMYAAYVELFSEYENSFAHRMGAILGLFGDERTRLGVTNLGVLSIPTDYDGFKITNIIPVAPCIATSEKVVTVSTFNGRMLIADAKIVKK